MSLPGEGWNGVKNSFIGALKDGEGGEELSRLGEEQVLTRPVAVSF